MPTLCQFKLPLEGGTMHTASLDRPATASAPARTATRDAGRDAFLILRVAFTVAPIAFGLDKFFNVLVDWPVYLAGWVDDLMPGSAQDFMYAVGAVEILAGMLV